MKCQYIHGCVRMATDNGYDLCSFHYENLMITQLSSSQYEDNNAGEQYE